MPAEPLHPWNVTCEEAIALQKRLRRLLRAEPLRPWPRYVAGADVAYERDSNLTFAAVVVVRLTDLETVEECSTVCETTFPYVPGLLSFREGPAVLGAFESLRRKPDVVIFDGQGRAHPRGLGLAAHMGLWLSMPTVGCAKSILVGEGAEPKAHAGARTPLRYRGRVVGALVRTRDNVKPVVVSAGHLIRLSDAVKLVLQCCDGRRLPEPTRRAHALVNALRAARRPTTDRGRCVASIRTTP